MGRLAGCGASIEQCGVTLYSRNGLIVSDNYKLIAKELERLGTIASRAGAS